MATLQVIYQIAADISKLESGVTRGAASLQRLETGFDRVSSVAAKIGPMIAGAFTVQAIASFAGEVLELGGHLTDLRDKTGISVEGLQQLKMAADLSGNTLEQVTAAVSQMQNRLSSGDKSAVGAVDALGMSMTALMGLKPDQQFREIAKGIAAIEDPAERTRVAMDLFGRSGAELLPLLVSDIDAVSDATTVMSTETAEALDRAGDAWTAFTNNAKAAAAGVIAVLLPATKEETRALQHMADVVDGLEKFDARLLGAPTVGSGLPRATPLSVPGLPTPEVMRESDVALRRLEESNRALIASQRESARQHAEMVSRFSRVDLEVWKVRDSVQGLGQDWSDLREVMIPTKTGFDAFDRVLRTMGDTTIPTLDSEMDRLGNTLGDYGPTLDQLGFKTKGVGDYLSQVESILGGVQTAWAQMVTVAVRGIRAIAQNLAEGDWIGAIVSGVTAFGSAIANAFRDEEWESVNDLRDTFFDAEGGLGAYHKKLVETLGPLGDFLTRQILNARTTRDYEAAVSAANEALEEHQRKLDLVKELVDGLGPLFNDVAAAVGGTEQELDDLGVIAMASVGAALEAGYSLAQAIEMNHGGLQRLREGYAALGISAEDAGLKALLIQDAMVTSNPTLLNGIGALGASMNSLATLGLLNADTFGAMERTGLAMFAKLQSEAEKAGGSQRDALLPMQSFLHEAEQRAKELGVPLDDNLQMLIDQSKELGIWKETGKTANEQLIEGLERLVRKMDEFIERIGRAGREMAGLRMPDSTVPDVPIPMANGGSGVVTRPTLFLAGEAGPEEFAFSGANRRFGGGEGIIQINLTSVLDGRVAAQSVSQHQARDLMTRSRLRAA